MVNVLEHSQVVSPVYGAAAAGLAALTQAATAEFAAHNIRLHALAGDKIEPQTILDLCLQEQSPIVNLH
jgi:NAD(P)-dependent dehydrogenase (short-subunit alcohol dehydrogenase family)